MSNLEEIGVTTSSGNVFEDLGLPNPEERLAKAQVAYLINRTIKERGLSQSEAGRLLGIDQPKVSALSRGRLAGFSLDRLFRFLMALGLDVEVSVRKNPADQRQGTLRVHAGV